MTHKEKLDKVLYLLYPYRYESGQLNIADIMKEAGVYFDSEEPRIIAKRLESDGLIKAIFTFDEVFVSLTSHGIEYCEEESYSTPNLSIINIFSITESPNATIITGDKNKIVGLLRCN